MKGLGAGSLLPPSAAAAYRLLGSAAPGVRVHTGPAAAAAAAAFGNGALAVTLGRHIAVSPRAPALDSSAGSLLLAHEAAHVTQQTRHRGSGTAHDPERDADVAAVAASTGGPIPSLDAATGPQGFEASKHQASLTHAMQEAGFTDREQDAAYFANWCRDMSQAIVPTVVDHIGAEAATTLVSILAEEKFGRPITATQLGAYKPVEHIDSPAGQIPADFVQKGQGILPLASGRGQYDLNVADYSPEHIAEQYQVNDSGVPHYIMLSREYIKTEARAALEAGRTPEGLAHVGNFSHTMEDLFAHSNWIEAAIGYLIKNHAIPLPRDVQEDVTRREKRGEPAVETYAAELHTAANEARPILMTGSFSGGEAGNDTFVSIKAEVQNMLGALVGHANPFREGGNKQKYWALALQILGHVKEAANANALGQMIVAQIDEIIDKTHPGAAITGVTGGLAKRTRGMEGFTGRLARGAAQLLDRGTRAVVEEVGEAWRGTLRQGVAGIVNRLGKELDLVAIALYVEKAEGALENIWKDLRKIVMELPKAIRDLILPKLAAAEKEFKDRMRELCDAALEKAVGVLLDALEAASKRVDVAETNLDVKLDDLREGLRKKLKEVIGRVAPEEQRPALIARIESALPEELVGIAGDPALKDMLAGLDEKTRTSMERIRQLESVPEWVRASASHSQLAKDHPDSPFFGAAFVVANAADVKMMTLMRRAWAERGYAGPTKALAGGYARTEESETGDYNPIIDPHAAEAHRQNRFLETRDKATYILEHGIGEPQLIEDLRKALEQLVEVQKARPLVGPLARGLIDTIRHHPDTPAVLDYAERLRNELAPWLEQQELERQVGRAEDRAGRAGEAAVRRVLRLLDSIKASFHHEGHERGSDPEHAHGPRTEAHFVSQIDTLNRWRGPDRGLVGPHVEGDRGLDARVAKARTVEDTLFAEIDRIFAHPYDSTWWHEILRNWARAHPSVVAQSIRDRNTGRAHSHPH